MLPHVDHDEAATEMGVITQHVAYSIGMLSALPRYAAAEATGLGEVGSACLEAFYVHVRVLADFFLPPAKKRYPTDRDVSDLSPTWLHPEDDQRIRLLKVRELTNQQIAHITAERLTTETEDTSTAALVGLARDVLRVVDLFCAECTDADVTKVQFIRYASEGAVKRLDSLHPPRA